MSWSDIIAIINSNGESRFPWKMSLWIFFFEFVPLLISLSSLLWYRLWLCQIFCIFVILWHRRWAPTDHKCSEFFVETPTLISLIAMIASKRFSVAKLTNRQTSDSTEQWVKWKCCPVNATTSKVGKKAGGATLRHTRQNHKEEGVFHKHRLDTPCL